MVFAMPAATFREAQDWLQIILGHFIAQAGLSEVGNGGIAKQLAAGVAQALDEATYQNSQIPLSWNIATAQGTVLKRRVAEIFPYKFTPLNAQRAQASLTFSRSQTVGAVTILAGTQVQDQAGNVFLTLQDATLADGLGTLAGVGAVAKVPGIIGNLAANTLTLFGNRPSGIDAVTNPAPALGGQDSESDDSIKARAFDYVNSLSAGTAAAFRQAVLGLQDPDTLDTILYAQVAEDPTRPMRAVVYVSDASGNNESRSTAVTAENLTATSAGPPYGTASGGEKRFVLANWPIDINAAFTLTSSTQGNLATPADYTVETSNGQVVLTQGLVAGEKLLVSYAYHTGLIQLAQRRINGYPDDFSVYSPVRVAGQFVRVAVPQVNPQDVTCTLTMMPGFSSRPVYQAVADAIQSVLQGLGIGQDLLLAVLVNAAMSQAGVANIVFTQPTGDVLVGDGQLIRPGTVSVK